MRSYYLPGLFVEEHSVRVPLDWTHSIPGQCCQGSTISLFYRVLSSPQHAHDKLPLLAFLQGGPGGKSPRPINRQSVAWIDKALDHFRIVLVDQRGTGLSHYIDGLTISHIEGAKNQARYLQYFLADSIVRDMEHVRLTCFDGQKWSTLGQSYGGFLTLSYLSLFPQAINTSFVTGGIGPAGFTAKEVYEHTVPRMIAKTQQWYEKYPQDKILVNAVADCIERTNSACASNDNLSRGMDKTKDNCPCSTKMMLPNGDPLTIERLQTLGGGLGMKTTPERLHWLFEEALACTSSVDDSQYRQYSINNKENNGYDISPDSAMSITEEKTISALSYSFLSRVAQETESSPLYWPLQEFIYANGELDEPIDWAAYHVINSNEQYKKAYDAQARPVMFTGEAIFPWMFEQECALKPFAPAMEILMEQRRFGKIYDLNQLANNNVPLYAAVYYDDMYVDSGLQQDVLHRTGNSHPWITNEFEHDGLHGTKVFTHLYQQALDAGDLSEALHIS